LTRITETKKATVCESRSDGATRMGHQSENSGAVLTSKSSKKRVSSCPELCRHGTGQQTGSGSMRHKILTSSLSSRGVARRRWRFADTDPMGISTVSKAQKVDAPYDRTAHADTESKLHFVLHSHPHRGDVFCCVCLTDRVR
jgi:hypothetical protein